MPLNPATNKLKISLDLSKLIVDEIDNMRKKNNMSRTHWIQLAIIEKFKRIKEHELDETMNNKNVKI